MANNGTVINVPPEQPAEQSDISAKNKLVGDIQKDVDNIDKMKLDVTSSSKKLSYSDALKVNAANNELQRYFTSGVTYHIGDNGDITYIKDGKPLPENDQMIIRKSQDILDSLTAENKYNVGIDLLSEAADTVLGSVAKSMRRKNELADNYKKYYEDLYALSAGKDLEDIKNQKIAALNAGKEKLNTEYNKATEQTKPDDITRYLTGLATAATGFITGASMGRPDLGAAVAYGAAKEVTNLNKAERIKANELRKDLFSKYITATTSYDKEISGAFDEYAKNLISEHKAVGTEALDLVKKDMQEDIDRSKELIKKDVSAYSQLVGGGYLDKDDAKNQMKFALDKLKAKTEALKALSAGRKIRGSGTGGGGGKPEKEEKVTADQKSAGNINIPKSDKVLKDRYYRTGTYDLYKSDINKLETDAEDIVNNSGKLASTYADETIEKIKKENEKIVDEKRLRNSLIEDYNRDIVAPARNIILNKKKNKEEEYNKIYKNMMMTEEKKTDLTARLERLVMVAKLSTTLHPDTIKVIKNLGKKEVGDALGIKDNMIDVVELLRNNPKATRKQILDALGIYEESD